MLRKTTMGDRDMTRGLIGIVLCGSLLSAAHAVGEAAEDVLDHVLPSPVTAEKHAAGAFRPDGAAVVAGSALSNEAAYLAEHLALPVASGAVPAGARRIELSIDAKRVEKPEGYVLKVEPDRLAITGGAPAGVFRGIQTLLQVVALGDGSVPLVSVEDAPAYGWRGLMLDSARKFYTVEEIKTLLEQMARYKLNGFHWHMIDNEAWRLEIKAYPELTKACGRAFYTQEQVKEVVAFAAARHIRVLPEIEMPGHSGAALRAKPELRCNPEKGGQAYCAGKEGVFTYVDRVMREVAALFPEPFVHIGADEVRYDSWRACPDCRARMKEEGIESVRELQGYFVRRVEGILKQHGKRLVGWDEIAEDGLSRDAVVMYWRSRPKHKGLPEASVRRAVAAGHDVLMSPQTFCYFDFPQGDWTKEPTGWNGTVTLETVYGMDPRLGDLPQERVLGGQANVWTTRIRSNEMLQYMIFPRALALAEVLWRGPEREPYDAFARSLGGHLALFDRAGITYRFPANIHAERTDHGVVLQPELHGAPVVYTLDGSAPGADSPRYEAPITWQAGVKPLLHIRAAVLKADGRPARTEDIYLADFTDLREARVMRVKGGRPNRIIIDGSLWRKWESKKGAMSPETPVEITIDLGTSRELHGIIYYPRQDGGRGGHITDYEVLVSDAEDAVGVSVGEGTWAPDRTAKTAIFPEVRGRYLTLRCRDGVGGLTSMAELKMF